MKNLCFTHKIHTQKQSYPQVIHNMWIFLGKNKVDKMPVDNSEKIF